MATPSRTYEQEVIDRATRVREHMTSVSTLEDKLVMSGYPADVERLRAALVIAQQELSALRRRDTLVAIHRALNPSMESKP